MTDMSFAQATIEANIEEKNRIELSSGTGYARK
jgi:hypothetical protein